MKQIIVDGQVTNYFITKEGKCFNSNSQKYLKGQMSNSGYLNFNLTLQAGEKRRLYSHRLVAEAYLKPKNELATQVNHIDGDKLNNNISNLCWVTPSENIQHAIRTGLLKGKTVYCFAPDKRLIKEYSSVASVRADGFSPNHIRQELGKEEKSLAYGAYWSYDKEIKRTKNHSNKGVPKKVVQFDLDGRIVAEFPSTGAAGRSLGLKNYSHIGECCRGKIKTYKGFVWKYREDIV